MNRGSLTRPGPGRPFVFARCTVCSAVVALATAYVVSRTGMDVLGATGVHQERGAHVVNRARKGDSLPTARSPRFTPAPIGETPTSFPERPIGCDTAFSPLHAPTQANFLVRCLANIKARDPLGGLA
jgi:hypothetical protein